MKLKNIHQNKELAAQFIASFGLPVPEFEYRFHPVRRWRFDFCWRPQMLALEVEGGAWIPGGGRHNRAQGFHKDREKYSAAAILGWRIVYATPQTFASGAALEDVKRALASPTPNTSSVQT